MSKILLVFDFDCTLTTKHFYYYMNNLDHFAKTWNVDINGKFPSPLMKDPKRIQHAKIGRAHV